MKLFRHPLLLLSFCTTALTLAACSGGGSDSAMPDEQQQQNDDTVETPSNPTNNPSDTVNDTNTPTSSDSFSEGFLRGNFRLTATATTQSNPLLDCSVTPGAVSVYNGEIIGFIDGYLDVNGTVSSSGQVTGSANSSGTTTASLTGQLSNAGGSGTWNQTGLCSGNWNMQPMDFNQPGDGEAFTLSDDQFPAALRIRFSPNATFSENEVECTSSVGIVHTNGRVGASDKELDYKGYTETSAGYRSDIDLSIDTDSGEVDGAYRYDPLGISGDFDGDAYFAGTPRTYTSRNYSYDNGCVGDWEMTVVDIPFPDRPAVTNEAATESDATQSDGADDDIVDDSTTDDAQASNDQTEDINNPDVPTEAETPSNETVDSSDQEQSNEPTTNTTAGFYNVTPYCVEAGQRIQQSIEIGMTVQQVREIVGKPMSTSGHGTFWDYSRRSSTPEIRFQAVLTGGDLQAGTVSDYDSDTSGCNNSYDALIEAANALALETPGIDRTLETPTCRDAGIRIQAYLEFGMSPTEVRRIVGKPIETAVAGTFWDYGRRSSNPDVRFNPVSTAQGLSAGQLVDFDSDISGCP